MKLDKYKLVEFLEELICKLMDEDDRGNNVAIYKADIVVDIKSKIKSGEFDCKVVNSRWKPVEGDTFLSPCYVLGEWSVDVFIYTYATSFLLNDANKNGEAFKTESDCKRYMNAKNYINDGKLWK